MDAHTRRAGMSSRSQERFRIFHLLLFWALQLGITIFSGLFTPSCDKEQKIIINREQHSTFGGHVSRNKLHHHNSMHFSRIESFHLDWYDRYNIKNHLHGSFWSTKELTEKRILMIYMSSKCNKSPCGFPRVWSRTEANSVTREDYLTNHNKIKSMNIPRGRFELIGQVTREKRYSPLVIWIQRDLLLPLYLILPRSTRPIIQEREYSTSKNIRNTGYEIASINLLCNILP